MEKDCIIVFISCYKGGDKHCGKCGIVLNVKKPFSGSTLHNMMADSDI